MLINIWGRRFPSKVSWSISKINNSSKITLVSLRSMRSTLTTWEILKKMRTSLCLGRATLTQQIPFRSLKSSARVCSNLMRSATSPSSAPHSTRRIFTKKLTSNSTQTLVGCKTQTMTSRTTWTQTTNRSILSWAPTASLNYLNLEVTLARKMSYLKPTWAIVTTQCSIDIKISRTHHSTEVRLTIIKSWGLSGLRLPTAGWICKAGWTLGPSTRWTRACLVATPKRVTDTRSASRLRATERAWIS